MARAPTETMTAMRWPLSKADDGLHPLSPRAHEDVEHALEDVFKSVDEMGFSRWNRWLTLKGIEKAAMAFLPSALPLDPVS